MPIGVQPHCAPLALAFRVVVGFLVFAAGCALAACGGGGSTSPLSSAPPTPAPTPHPSPTATAAPSCAAPPGGGCVVVPGIPAAQSIVVGPDGNIWLATGGQPRGENDGPPELIRFAVARTSLSFFTLATNAQPQYLAAGADGNIWLFDANNALVERVNASGTIISRFAAPASLTTLVPGSDGNVYLLADGTYGYFTPAGTLATFALPGANGPTMLGAGGPGGTLLLSNPYSVSTIGADGAITGTTQINFLDPECPCVMLVVGYSPGDAYFYATVIFVGSKYSNFIYRFNATATQRCGESASIFPPSIEAVAPGELLAGDAIIGTGASCPVSFLPLATTGPLTGPVVRNGMLYYSSGPILYWQPIPTPASLGF